MVITQEKQGLGGFVNIKGDEPDPIRVVLRPLGTVIGRLVDENGKARPGIGLSIGYELKSRGDQSYSGPPPDEFETDRDGRFRIPNLVPGLRCAVSVRKKNPKSAEDEFEGSLKGENWQIKPGELLDWGDIRVTE